MTALYFTSETELPWCSSWLSVLRKKFRVQSGVLNEANVCIFIAMKKLQVESNNFHLFIKNADFLPFVLQLAIMVTLKIFENHWILRSDSMRANRVRFIILKIREP